ncbi:hypothetical protein ACFPIJ_61955 [Dactylosporangium cerinum]|uniref:Uncharacterized protein n=1 Tax=Dactylosporangium cerinum TaxID=1434730 RepID=A0ABV9WMN7_9ACTN
MSDEDTLQRHLASIRQRMTWIEELVEGTRVDVHALEAAVDGAADATPQQANQEVRTESRPSLIDLSTDTAQMREELTSISARVDQLAARSASVSEIVDQLITKVGSSEKSVNDAMAQLTLEVKSLSKASAEAVARLDKVRHRRLDPSARASLLVGFGVALLAVIITIIVFAQVQA